MSNSTNICNPYIESTLTSPFSCVAPTAPYNSSFNATTGPNTYTKDSLYDNLGALRSCCTSDVNAYGNQEGGACYYYCTEKDQGTFSETQACIKNYTSQHPEESFSGITCPDSSGATMLGRTGGWGGLVILSLVVSAAATMM
ncbi:hypothetical protein VE03_01168 [Pseudogymnoascus sp. 23342-1-I1]|nr:hypothetical protein VE03_01168 [Pseudogymnoascus sp. 23342-1-I1]